MSGDLDDDLVKKHGKTPLRLRDLKWIADGIADAVRGYLQKSLVGPFAELSKRVNALETRQAFHYRGIWDQAQHYDRGDFCTDKGSLFHCNRPATRQRPGEGSDWTLAVKRGRDGRDAGR